MKRIGLLLLCFFGVPLRTLAVPVVPNFQQGSMTSHTETESTVTETINSIDYRTGWEYSVTGTGVSNNNQPLNPPVNTSDSYTHIRAHETREDGVWRLLL